MAGAGRKRDMVDSVLYRQGTIIKVEGIKENLVVISHDLFNRTEQVFVCPIKKKASKDPLHIAIKTKDVHGFVLCEHLRKIDLTLRGFQLKSELSLKEMMEVSYVVQALFNYS